jgi:hypothetical protein
MALLLAHFYKIRNIMYGFVNIPLISFQKCFGVLTCLCHGKHCKSFLISNVFAGSVALCRGQHVYRELRIERAWNKQCFTTALKRCKAGAPKFNL